MPFSGKVKNKYRYEDDDYSRVGEVPGAGDASKRKTGLEWGYSSIEHACKVWKELR